MERMAYWQQASLSLPRCSYLYSRDLARWYNRAHIVLNSSQENAHLNQGASGREKRSNE